MDCKIVNGDNISDFYSQFKNTSKSLIRSPVPDVCKKEPCILGVDEAGRGPVLGPMVYGISFCPISKKDEFGDLGCADSKALTEQKREELFAILCACDEYVGWAVDVISPNYISNCMLRRSKCSLNEVAADSTISLIKGVIEEGAQISEIYVDTVGPPEKYQDRLSQIFPECKVTVAKKADALYPIVSAASICAKVVRDKIIGSWKFAEDIQVDNDNYGSGYPNDPGTKSFLSTTIDDIFGFPNIVRFSWSTASKILDDKATTVEWDEETEVGTKQTITSFFKSGLSGEKHSMKHQFFLDNSLRSTDSFA